VLYRLGKVARRRRKELALAASMALVLALALSMVAGSVGWALNDAATRRMAADRHLEQALADIDSTYAAGNLPTAIVELKRAEALAVEKSISPQLVADVQRWRKDLDLATRLEKLRLERSNTLGDHYDWRASDEAYRQALGDYGIDADGPAQVAADRIRQSVLRSRLTEALDDWGQVRLRGGSKGWTQLVAVLRLVDDDPYRNEVREVALDGEVPSLLRLAADERATKQPSATVSLLAQTLRRCGHGAEAAALLRKAQVERPDDFWLNTDLAAILARETPASAAEAVGYYRAALVARPRHAGLHSDLGHALGHANQHAQAEEVLRRGLEIDPNHYRVRNNLAVALEHVQRLDEAETEYRQLLSGTPDYVATGHAGLAGVALKRKDLAEAETQARAALHLDSDHHRAREILLKILRGQGRTDDLIAFLAGSVRDPKADAQRKLLLADALAGSGRWRQAAEAYQQVLDQNADDHWHWFRYAILLAHQGDEQHYFKVCNDMLVRFEKDPNPQIRERSIKAALLLPGDEAHAVRCRDGIREAMKQQEEHRFYWYFMLCRGLAEYRAGENVAALHWLQRLALREGRMSHDAVGFVLLAMVYQRTGDHEAAREALASARATADARMPDFSRQLSGDWHDWLVYLLLVRQAEQESARRSSATVEANPAQEENM
jgi:Flp pilus assembly protein TadD